MTPAAKNRILGTSTSIAGARTGDGACRRRGHERGEKRFLRFGSGELRLDSAVYV